MTRCNCLRVLIAALSLSVGVATASAQGAPEEPASNVPADANEPVVMPPVAPTVPEVPAEATPADPPAEGLAVEAEAKQVVVPEKPGVVITGSFFTRYELREGYAELGKTMGRFSESDFVRYRARLGLATTPVDIGKGKKVILSFAPQASGFWADKGGTLTDGALGVHTATMRIKGDSYWIDTGRFEMAYGEHLVIGTVGWHETARSFDGVRSHIELNAKSDKKPYVDVFMTQVAEDPAEVKPLGAGDTYFGGVYAGLGPMLGEGMDLDGYVLSHVIPKSSKDGELGLQVTVGSRIKKQMGMLDVRGEAGVQFGSGSVDQMAFHADAELGAKVSDKLRVAAGGWYASGDDPTTTTVEAWSQLYPTAHKFMGFMDILGGRSNIMGGIGRAKFKASPALVVGADAHLFLRPQTPDGVDAYTGIELDTFALHKIGKGLGLRGGYSLFVPNETGPYGTSDVAHYIEIQLKYDLK